MIQSERFRGRKPRFIGEDELKKYAVLVPFINREDGIHILFEIRNHDLKRNPGEICFPGGRLELDESLEDCALRETAEELLVDKNQITIYGPSDIYFSPFNFIVYPYVGEIKGYKNSYSKHEVADIVSIPLDYFLTYKPELYISDLVNQPPKDFPYEWIPGGENYPFVKGRYEILFYRYKDFIIWGMTAKILNSVINLIGD